MRREIATQRRITASSSVSDGEHDRCSDESGMIKPSLMSLLYSDPD